MPMVVIGRGSSGAGGGENDLPKKDFRRGGSYPPPEVRHGWKAASDIQFLGDHYRPGTMLTIPLLVNPVNRESGRLTQFEVACKRIRQRRLRSDAFRRLTRPRPAFGRWA